MEQKTYNFSVGEHKQLDINGQKIGVIRGLASTFEVDEDNDQIMPGAFRSSIEEHKSRNNRPIRMRFQHDRKELIGGWPIELVRETDRGLEVEGHVNLEVQRGREVFSLAKQGVIRDTSISFGIKDFEIRNANPNEMPLRQIKDLDLREISPVDEPANRGAQITEVKTVLKTVKDINYLFKKLGLSHDQRNEIVWVLKNDSNESTEKFLSEFNLKLDNFLLGTKLNKIINMQK